MPVNVKCAGAVAAVCSSALLLMGCRSARPPADIPLDEVNYEVGRYGDKSGKVSGDAKRVLVVYNIKSPISRKIADYYSRMRHIPSDQVIGLDCTDAEHIGSVAYRVDIESKVRNAIGHMKNQIDFIVLAKGVPLCVGGDFGYSVDACLASMNLSIEPMPEDLTKLTQGEVDRAVQRNTNPYASATEPFSSKKYNMYLVTRLDGYTWADVKQLVDQSLAAKPVNGPFFFDCAVNRTWGGYEALHKSMIHADELLQSARVKTIIDKRAEFTLPPSPVVGYVSWGSNDGKYDRNTYRKIRFLPGAIAETYVSTSGRTMVPTERGQSLIADLVHQGVTGVKGYVTEPYTFALCPADVLVTRYLTGFNLAESFYAASPVIHWKDIVIGDPLCNPYRSAK